MIGLLINSLYVPGIFGVNGIYMSNGLIDSVNRLQIHDQGSALDLQNEQLFSSTGNGFIYSEDYSDNFTDRSLVDKAYVDQAIAAAIAALP